MPSRLSKVFFPIQKESNDGARAAKMNGAARSGGSAGPGPKASPGPRATAMARSRRDSFDAMAGKEETRIERVGLRLAGLDSYATLTSLTAGLSTLNLSDLSLVFADDAPHPTHEKVAILVSLVLQTLTISLGLHATLVFSMTSLYAKTAIGGGHDDAYSTFMKATGAVRTRGFQSFLWTFITFGLNLIFGLVCRLPMAYAAPTCALAIIVLVFVWTDVRKIIHEAGFIFAPRKGD